MESKLTRGGRSFLARLRGRVPRQDRDTADAESWKFGDGSSRYHTPALLLAGLAASALFSLLVSRAPLSVPKPAGIIIKIFVLYFAIVVHEVSHGFIAYLRGDPTAKVMGRLTLNPLPHIDLFGTIIIPGFLIIQSYFTGSNFIIGWAKPVPVDIRRFSDPLRDFAITSMAGPASNFLQAVVYAILFRMGYAWNWPDWALYLGIAGAGINLFLGVFNLIPIPPLDGSRLVAAALPTRLAVQYLSIERFGFVIIFGLLFFGAFDVIAILVQGILNLILF
jgi:Zn-dependent protease